jgi:succinoglycan biosynthesis protein ExoM
MSQANSPSARIDICVATFKRPEGLRRLLESLIRQETRSEFCHRLIVVDNDARRSAEPVVREFFSRGVPLIYDVEPRQNISLARNRTLSHATGEFIATIDDDEYADHRWLLNLYKTMVTYDADVVHGPVVPLFPPNTPAYVKNSALVARPELATGSTENYTPYTANSLFRRKLIEALPAAFDPRFGRTGGEDILFFHALRRQGHKLIWCNDAVVFASIPPDRANLSALTKRYFRNGYITYRMSSEAHLNEVRVDRAAVFRCCVRLGIGLGAMPFYLFADLCGGNSSKALRSLEETAFRAGFLAAAFRFRYEAYRGEKT